MEVIRVLFRSIPGSLIAPLRRRGKGKYSKNWHGSSLIILMKAFSFSKGDTAIITAAIHEGHVIREELLPFLALEEHERSREADPYTDYFSEVSTSRVRSEERRVGKACIRKCRYRGSPSHKKKKQR